MTNFQYSLSDTVTAKFAEKLPSIDSPVSCEAWFYDNYIDNLQTIKDYCLAVSKATVSTAHFLPVSDGQLPSTPS